MGLLLEGFERRQHGHALAGIPKPPPHRDQQTRDSIAKKTIVFLG
jgi:hypothetical protein